MSMSFASVKIGKSFELNGIRYVKTGTITAESEYSIGIFENETVWVPKR